MIISMKNVTYLFGAGASAKAIPTYTAQQHNFTTCFRDFLDTYFIQKPSNKQFAFPIITLDDLIKASIVKINEEVLHHYSVDTYAKKLYLQNSVDSMTLLKILKCLISFCIEYLQVVKIEKRINLDQRYDVFFSAILERTDHVPKLPEHIRLISWNYDNQIELTLSNLNSSDLSIDNIQSNYGIFPSKKSMDEIQNNPHFTRHIKLNGQSGNHIVYKPKKESISTITYSPGVFGKLTFTSRLTNALNAFNTNLPKESEFLINFAWEYENKNEYSKIAVEKSLEIMEFTNILIIIGYSFPAYNYKVDRLLFSKLKNCSKIRYQTVADNSSDQEEKLKLYLNEAQKKQFNIKHINSAGNFILPHEI